MNSTSVEQIPVQQTPVTFINSNRYSQHIKTQQELSKPRVAAYCRVSTEEELQLGSLENQIIHYTNRIRANTDWYFAGIYSDKGKSGTSLANRTGFNRMVRNALNGEIDLIICKSISRFARNVVDTLDTVRQLNEKGIHIIFERERLNTKESSSSLILKVLATFAEEESRNTSENIEWSLNKRFERGEVMAPGLYGYRIKKNKEWEIIEDEAEIVREAYLLFLKGYSMAEIAKQFIRKGYKKRSGNIDWNGSNIKAFLTNERYAGDALNRKTCTLDFRSHKTIKNKGHKPQYYVEDHHEGIVSKEDFQAVQELFSEKKVEVGPKRYTKTPYSGRVVCATCGKNFHRRNSKMYATIWHCSTRNKSTELCEAEQIKEEKLEKFIIQGFEKRYNIGKKLNDGLLIKQLIKELSNAEAVRDREQNLLRVELEKYLIAEEDAILKNLDLTDIRAKRIEVEQAIEKKKKLWEDFDKDHGFREAALKQLKTLNGSDTAIHQILDISFIRAWVIHIKVKSPFLINIKWIDGEETVAGEPRGGPYNATKQRKHYNKSKSTIYSSQLR